MMRRSASDPFSSIGMAAVEQLKIDLAGWATTLVERRSRPIPCRKIKDAARSIGGCSADFLEQHRSAVRAKCSKLGDEPGLDVSPGLEDGPGGTMRPAHG